MMCDRLTQPSVPRRVSAGFASDERLRFAREQAIPGLVWKQTFVGSPGAKIELRVAQERGREPHLFPDPSRAQGGFMRRSSTLRGSRGRAGYVCSGPELSRGKALADQSIVRDIHG